MTDSLSDFDSDSTVAPVGASTPPKSNEVAWLLVTGRSGFLSIGVRTKNEDLLGPFTDVIARDQLKSRATRICLVSYDNQLHYLGILEAGRDFTTLQRRIALRHVVEIKPIPLEALLRLMAPATRHHLQTAVRSGGGAITPGTWIALLTAIGQASPEVRRQIDQLRFRIQGSLQLAAEQSFALAEERDAVALSLMAADMSRRPLKQWQPPDRPADTDPPAPFLRGITHLHGLEIDMVHYDLNRFPDWVPVGRSGSVVMEFRDGNRRLTVVNTHAKAERVLGVDLVYYRHETHSFVLVQYKRLRQEGKKWLYRPSADRNYESEMQRMQTVTDACSPGRGPDAFRLHGSPCFIKLCKPTEFHADGEDLIRGLYLPLAYWKELSASGQVRGPQGGEAFSHESVRRWMDAALFTGLVADSWIGSADVSSNRISNVLHTYLDSVDDRSAMIAIEDGPGRRRRPRPYLYG